MKKVCFGILIICALSIYSQDRVNREKLNYQSESGFIFDSTGWTYNDLIGEWVSHQNYISDNKHMDSYVSASKEDQNFTSLYARTVTFSDNIYYIVFVDSYGGMYKYPSEKKDWTTFERNEAYIFTEEEYNKLTTLKPGIEVKLQTKMFVSERKHWLEADFIYYIHKALLEGDTSVDISFYVKKVDENLIRFLLPTSDSYFTGKYTGEVEYDFSKMYFETDESNFNKLLNFKGYNEINNALKIGMVTDAGTIDDKSYNENTWKGLLRARDDLGLEIKYLKPVGTTGRDYLNEIDKLYRQGYRFIVTPGFKFETTIYKAQKKYRDVKFVILDGIPHQGDFNIEILDNTVSIFYAEHESGFLAGVATALQLKEGSVGFIGGMEIPPVQKFNWGFQQGIHYANKQYGTSIDIDEKNIIYQGTFHEFSEGKTIAGEMYDNGVDAIFCVAGGVGYGAIQEAKERASYGESTWIVGVDVDQYEEGIYEDNKSVILTSALKRLDNSSYDMIQRLINNSFPGGQVLTYSSYNDGIGIPELNPNLEDSVFDTVQKVYNALSAGDLYVSNERGDLYK